MTSFLVTDPKAEHSTTQGEHTTQRLFNRPSAQDVLTSAFLQKVARAMIFYMISVLSPQTSTRETK